MYALSVGRVKHNYRGHEQRFPQHAHPKGRDAAIRQNNDFSPCGQFLHSQILGADSKQKRKDLT